jgi:hypothetical protein
VGPGHLSFLTWIVALGMTTLVVMPLATLGHELGHALVALRAVPGPVIVHVGRPPAWIELEWPRLKIRWSPVPARGVPFAGLCVWRADLANPRARVAVCLAGPLVTILLIPVFLALLALCWEMADWIPATWGLSAFAAFIGVLINLDPRTSAEASAARGTIRRDGPKALAAYRVWRASS